MHPHATNGPTRTLGSISFIHPEQASSKGGACSPKYPPGYLSINARIVACKGLHLSSGIDTDGCCDACWLHICALDGPPPACLLQILLVVSVALVPGFFLLTLWPHIRRLLRDAGRQSALLSMVPPEMDVRAHVRGVLRRAAAGSKAPKTADGAPVADADAANTAASIPRGKDSAVERQLDSGGGGALQTA
jgi:hypothetical protein